VDDTGDADDSVGVLTPTTLTGLDMPTVPEVQTVAVQAKGGTYTLVMPGYGSASFDYTYTAAQFRDRLAGVYGSTDLRVSEARSTTNVVYTVQFVGGLAGIDFDEMVWDEENSALIPNPDASAEVLIATLGARDADLRSAVGHCGRGGRHVQAAYQRLRHEGRLPL
jgi:hypothetical protein